jgi:exosortase E/protease (VPEID-CTERM system)
LTRFILRPVSRHLFLLVFLITLLAEVLCLSVAFDGEVLVRSHSPWAALISAAPQYLRFAAASLAVTLLLAGRQQVLAWANGPRWTAGARIPFLAAHIAALAAFVATSMVVFERFASVSTPAVWSAGWFLAGLLTLFLWALAVFPFEHWVRTLSRARKSVALGLAGGAGLWAGALITPALWDPLAKYTFYVVRAMLALVYPNVISDPVRLVVGTPAFRVNIAPECSGFEGIALILGFLGLYLWIARKELRFPAAFTLLPAGVCAMWIANSVRITALVALGTSGWPAVARGGFHTQAGWLAFIAIALALAGSVTRGGYFSKDVQQPAAIDNEDPTPAYIAPLAAVLAASMLAGAFSAGFDWFYPLRLFVAATVLWMFRHEYRRLDWSWSPLSLAFGIAAFLAWLLLMPSTAAATSANWPSALATISPARATVWLLIRMTGYVVTAPIVEELAFRAFLTRRLIRPDFQRLPLGTFTWMSFVAASVIFGAFHGKFWVPATVAGMCFAAALYHRGSIGEAVQAHATTNGLIALYVLWTGRWFMWS